MTRFREIILAKEQPVWLRILSVLATIVALAYIAQFFVLASIRLVYPFELEWIEGAYVDEARWIAAGNPVYAEPSIHFMPINKTPLFFFLSGMLMKILGIGFVAPRLVSILSAAGCFFLLCKIVSRESGDPIAGVIAAGLYASAFRFAGAWMDIAKTDSLLLFLLLAAFFVGRRYASLSGLVVSGLLYVLAYFTKQLALPIILVVGFASLLASRGRTFPQWLTVGVVGLITFLILDAATDGWFSFYTFDALAYHDMSLDLWRFWRLLIAKMWPAILVGLLYIVSVLVTVKLPGILKIENLWISLGFVVALVLGSWVVFRKIWTYDNGFMPACVGLTMLAGLGYGYVQDRAQRPPWSTVKPFLVGASLVLVLCQFALLFYNPLDQLPTDEALVTWEKFVSHLRELPGEVLVLNHGFVNYLADKDSYLHSAPYAGVLGWVYEPGTGDNRWRGEVVREVLPQAIAEQEFGWIFSGGPEDKWLPYYVATDEDPIRFHPVTGPPASPEIFFIATPFAKGGELPLDDSSFDSLMREGWSVPEDWGRWAIGRRAVVEVALEQGPDYELTVEAFPFCPPGFEEQVMEVGWNHESLGAYTFASCESQVLTFDLPPQAITEGMNDLWFEFTEATSPAEVGISGDRRPLAVGFTSLAFTQR